ncbi:MAG: phytanoyl-CoA dioxygenase family protein [Armatimonadetes bacterium]|nr:phytanoyl-CoA dioxygenase family protein [Armatimonadota bacterium]
MRPISDLLPDEEDIAFYRANGHWIAPMILSDGELEEAREHHARVIAGIYGTVRAPWNRNIEPGQPIDHIVKIDNSYWADTIMARLALNPVVGAMAARLAGAKAIRLWHDQLLYKPPKSGEAGHVGWHQDFGYWQCADPPELLTAWIALDDVNEENGCMKVVPGSHKWGLVPEGNFFDPNLKGLEEKITASTGRSFETASCLLPAGSLSFHHCMTLHGSGPNLSAGPRRSLVVHLMPDGTRYRAGTPGEGHMNVRLLSGKDGDPFAGPYFPVLFREGMRSNPWEVG